MRRLEVVNKAFTFTNDNPPQYKNLSFQVQVIRDQFNVVRAEFYIEGQELQNFLDNGMDYDQLAEEKMKWILETNTTPVDSFVLESIQREQDRVGIAVEENKALAIEQATEAAMQIASEKVESVRADIETSDQKMDQIEQEIKEMVRIATEKIETITTVTRKLARIDELTPDDIADLVALYDPWSDAEAVAVGDVRSHGGRLYKVVQAHTTQGDWTPDATPALWKEIAPPQTEDGEEIVPEWRQPTGAHDAYKIGDKVLFEGKVYESTINANTWSPIGYPQGWKEVTV